MGALEAHLVLSSDWPGDSTLNCYWLNFSRAKQKAVQEADWTCIIFYFYDKEFSLYTMKNLTSAFSMKFSMYTRLQHNS